MDYLEIVKRVFGQPKSTYMRVRSVLVSSSFDRQSLRVSFVNVLSKTMSRAPVFVEGLYPSIAHYPISVGLFNNVFCGLEAGLYEFLKGNKKVLYEEFDLCLQNVERFGPMPEVFISNALANAVGNAILTKALSGSLTQTGRVIFVYGNRGAGKTTLVFWSLLTVLRMLGINEEVATDIVKSLWVHDPEEYLEIQKKAAELARNGLALPFVVVEDAGVVLSKYMQVPSIGGAKVKLAATIVEMEQVAREGVCSTIFLSSPQMVLKGIRTLADMTIRGVFKDYTPRRHTVWIAKSASGDIEDVFATIHPPLKTPDKVLQEWMNEKLDIRIKLLESAIEQIKKSRESMKKKEEEELGEESE